VGSYADRLDFENVKRHSQRIKTAVNNLNTILTEFLSLGKLEEGKTEPNLVDVDLPELINEVHSEMKVLFRNGQTLSYEHQGAQNTLLDPGFFKHVLQNLLSNAIKYSPENSLIRINSAVQATEIGLEVIDQGMGIPMADQKHLFSRFFRAANSSNIQGTGLGLYIVKRYIELMNGQIGFESEEGKGTRFWVKIYTQPYLKKDQDAS
jgi:signal transduction histidine kinase